MSDYRTLCPNCLDKAQDRINAAVEHNQDKDVEWWVKWWDKECERQLKQMESCCEKGK